MTSTTTPPPSPTASGDPVSGRDGLRDTAREARDTARQHADRLGEDARAGLHAAQDAAAQRAGDAKDHAADELSRTAKALETAADELGDRSMQHDLLREAADGLMQISGAMRGRSVGDIVGDLSDFGRRNPLAFLGGAALAGFALGRFTRAGTPANDVGISRDMPRPPAAAQPVAPGIPGATATSGASAGMGSGPAVSSGTTPATPASPGATPGPAASPIGGPRNG